MKYKIRLIKWKNLYKHKSFKKPKNAICSVLQWPNESYSLFIRKRTKNIASRSREGMCIGTYYSLLAAKKAATKWLDKHRVKIKRNKNVK